MFIPKSNALRLASVVGIMSAVALAVCVAGSHSVTAGELSEPNKSPHGLTKPLPSPGGSARRHPMPDEKLPGVRPLEGVPAPSGCPYRQGPLQLIV